MEAKQTEVFYNHLNPIHQIVRLMEARDINVYHYLALADISPRLLQQKRGLIEQKKITKLVAELDKLEAEIPFSIAIGFSIDITQHEVSGPIFQNLPNMQALMRAIALVQNARRTGISVEYHSLPNELAMDIFIDEDFERENDCASIYVSLLTTTLNSMRLLFGTAFRPKYFSLKLDYPAVDKLSKACGCPVKTKQPVTRFAIDKKWENVRANMVMEHVDKEKKDAIASMNNLPELIFALLPALLPEDEFRLEDVAKLLGIHERVLQNRLKQAGTSYSTLLDDVRKSEAVDLLLFTKLAIVDISAELGYREPAVFIRRFKSWFKQTPLQWRKQAQLDLES